MLYIRLELLGDGTEDNPYRVDLPSYSEAAVDYGEMSAIVSCSPNVGPTQKPAQGTPLYPLINGVYVLIGLEPEQYMAWIAKLARSYPNRDVPFAPNFV